MTPADPAASASPLDQLHFNGQAVAYRVEGARTAEPDDRVLLAHAPDLSARAPWAAAGYAVVPGLPSPVQGALQTCLAERLREALRAAGCAVGPGEASVFLSCLLHGAAANLNDDATRVSLEMRFWQA